MSNVVAPTATPPPVDHQPPTQKMPGHWLLARMGKRVLRPGGIELTRELLRCLAITPVDDVVEFAPGLGVTARMTLSCSPRSYVAVERDPNAAAEIERLLFGLEQRCIHGTAERTTLASHSASVVYGEAMLSMQTAEAKRRIVQEAARLLRPAGRYAIHELCLLPDDIEQEVRDAIQKDLSDEIHVGVRPLTLKEWREVLTEAGLSVVTEKTALMHLLEPVQLVRDEGLLRATRFFWNVATHRAARRRVCAMRRLFRKYREHLAAVVLLAEKPKEEPT